MNKPFLRKLFWAGLRHFLSDKQYAKFRYWLELDRVPDIENPKRFTEKIQHIKLYQRTKLRKLAADRIRVRTYVTDKIGKVHLIPLIGNYQELTEQVWESLPSKFVLKANHGCKMNKIVTDKSEESFSEIKSLTEKWQQTDYYKFGREWVYKDLPRTIVAEELLENADGGIPDDYKFFCFDGKVEMVQVDFDRFEDHKLNLYDRKFRLIPVNLIYENLQETLPKPPQWNKAIELAEMLSSKFDFIRVDLFLVDQTIFFGELTNYPSNGFKPFKPDNFDEKLGKKWNLQHP
ncbi:ATP-grasp fold amidoligase family protein [soil metagenome]